MKGSMLIQVIRRNGSLKNMAAFAEVNKFYIK